MPIACNTVQNGSSHPSDRLASRPTSVINQIRAFLLERSIRFHTGRVHLRRHMPDLLEDTNEKLTAHLRLIPNYINNRSPNFRVIQKSRPDIERP